MVADGSRRAASAPSSSRCSRQRDPGAGDRGRAGAAVGLDDVAVEGDLALAQRLHVDDGAQAAADQALDLRCGRTACPAEASRRVRSWVARGSMPYSAVIQPRAWPLSHGGSRSSSLAVTSTWVSPNFTKQEPSAYFTTPRSSETGRSSSGCRPLGRMPPSSMPGAKRQRNAICSGGRWSPQGCSACTWRIAVAKFGRLPVTRAGGYALDGQRAEIRRESEMAQEVTQVLAKFAARRAMTISPRVRDHCKNLLLDALACAVAGRHGEETGQVAALASGLAQSSEFSVIGGERLSLAGATLLNGFLVTAVTMCDIHRATLTHVTPEVVPPALAIAERDGYPGRDSWWRIAAGCEMTTRIGIGLDYPAFRARGWHGPGILGPFGAAAAVGRLLGFDADTMARAFGLAGSQAAGTFAAWGTPTVKFHQCRGALSGLMAALLGAAEIRRDARISHRQGRRPLQHLRRWRQAARRPPPISASAGSSSRSRCGCGPRRRRSRA